MGRVKTQWTGNLSVPEIEAATAARKSKLPPILGAVIVIGGGAAWSRRCSPAVAARRRAVTVRRAARPARTSRPRRRRRRVPSQPGTPTAPPRARSAGRATAGVRAARRSWIGLLPPGADVKDLATGAVIGHHAVLVHGAGIARGAAVRAAPQGLRRRGGRAGPGSRQDRLRRDARARQASVPGAAPVVHKLPPTAPAAAPVTPTTTPPTTPTTTPTTRRPPGPSRSRRPRPSPPGQSPRRRSRRRSHRPSSRAPTTTAAIRRASSAIRRVPAPAAPRSGATRPSRGAGGGQRLPGITAG